MMFSEMDIFWMQCALAQALTARHKKEVPVGAVLIHENELIAKGHNRSIIDCDPSAHAEMVVLREGAKVLNNYRLLNTTLYVTLEPCLMCVGALVHARVRRVVFGAHDPRTGAVESILKIELLHQLNHKVIYHSGLLAGDCSQLLMKFFRSRRLIAQKSEETDGTAGTH